MYRAALRGLARLREVALTFSMWLSGVVVVCDCIVAGVHTLQFGTA